VQLGTIIAPDSQSLPEQMHDLVSISMQHFWLAPGAGHASAAAPVSVAGRSLVAPHWQKPSVASLLQAKAAQVQKSALPQHRPCSPVWVATDALVQAVRSPG
jgi:hypothetical protein